MKFHTKAIITILGLGLLALAQKGVLDDAGMEYTEKGLSRALVTYGISRSLNGVISVVQGTEVAIEPVGVGMTFTPGQILDPVNDLIERFSTIVLVSGTAFGVQRVFLDIVSTPAFSILVLILVLLALGVLWFARQASVNMPVNIKGAIYRIAIISLIIRLSVPTMAIATEKFYTVFLAPQYEESSQQLLSTTDQLQDIQSQTDPAVPAPTEDKSFLESAKELYRSAASTFDMQQHLEDFKAAAENISEHAIKLIVVFVFQTIILPLGSVWLILKAIKWVVVGRPLRLDR